MSANQGNTSRRLYFDVIFPATRHSQTFLCTQFTAGTPGDRYGCLLRALEAATGSTSPQVKRSRAVSAWYQPSGLTPLSATTPINEMFAVSFIAPIANGNYTTEQTKLPYLTVGNTAVINKVGNEAIYSVTSGLTRHFAVQVFKARATSGIGYGGSITSHGVLYVQRPHSIDV
jgi:hypothetical protein